jgi:hypothetical protein
MVFRGREGLDNRENHIYTEKISRTSWPISVKLSANHPWMKRIKYCSKEGPVSYPRGDNHINAK